MSDPIHNLEAERFEISQEGFLAVLDYELHPGRIVFTHTEVPAELEGRGLGGRLAKAGLEYARSQGLKVTPQCWFVAGYIERHPEYQDLLA